MNIDWSLAPEWAHFAAMNFNGDWYWFELEPTYNEKSGSWGRGFYEASGRNEKFNPARYAAASLSARPVHAK